MHEVKVDIVETEVSQTLLEAFLDTTVVGGPQLGGDEEVLARDNARVNGLLDSLADLVLVLVAQSSVNVTVAGLDGVGHGARNLSGLGLPCSQAKSRDLSTGVKLETGITGSHCE